MNVTLIRVTEDPEELVELAASICTNTEPSEAGMMTALNSGHLSITEHTSFTFLIEGVSRALLAQFTRHRLASFSVQSQRYADMENMPVVVPPTIYADKEMFDEYNDIMNRIRGFYRKAVKRGIPREDARYPTPQAACTKLLVTMNTRELLHFFQLRECNKAQWEIRNLASLMLAICKTKMPNVFKDAGAPCRSGKCPETRPCKEGPKAR